MQVVQVLLYLNTRTESIMKALISTIEPVMTGYRVAQVENDDKIFSVAGNLFWVDCDDNVIADRFWYDPSDETIRPL